MGTKAIAKLSADDIEILQEYNRCNRDIEVSNGENRISLLFYKQQLDDKIRELGLWDYAQYSLSFNRRELFFGKSI